MERDYTDMATEWTRSCVKDIIGALANMQYWQVDWRKVLL